MLHQEAQCLQCGSLVRLRELYKLLLLCTANLSDYRVCALCKVMAEGATISSELYFMVNDLY